MLKVPILVILRGIEEKHIEPVVDTLLRCGIDTVEITMNTKNADGLISKFINYSEDKLTIGAGTVINKEQLELALQAGASFIVTPVINPEVIKSCKEMNIPVFPGALTPTEVYNAWKYGATMVKVFPANVFGPNYLKDLQGPLNNIPLMAVGGVNAGNIKEYFLCGASAVAIGGSIFSYNRLENNDYKSIEYDLNKLIQLTLN